MILKEKGNYSKKHFGDFDKLKEFKEKYNIDLRTSYQTTYNFRIYADYRRFPKIKNEFDREHLNEQINKVKELIFSCLELLKNNEEFQELISLFKKRVENI